MPPVDLQSLHQAALAKKTPEELAQRQQEAEGKSLGSKWKDPFAAVVQAMISMSNQSLREALVAVDEACAAMDEVRSTTPAEEKLMLAETSLSSVSHALKQSLTTLTEAEQDVQKRNPWIGDTLEHYRSLLVTLVDRVSSRRIEVGICREECAAYKAEMRRHSCCGVLCSPMDAVGRMVKSTEGSGASGGSKVVKRQVLLDDDDERESGRRGGGAVVEASRQMTAKAVEAAVHTFHTQTSAVASLTSKFADETARIVTEGTGKLRARQGTSSESMSAEGGATGGPSIKNVALSSSVEPTAFVFSEEETRRFEAEGEVLLAQQQSAEAEAARDVEQSVQQLSQLNSLVSEHVFAQGEQVAILERNTEQSRSTLKKTAEQLQKPLERRWNSSRLFILFVWVNIAVLALAHWIIR